MSPREQRQLIEAAFIPHACKCTICTDGYVRVLVTDPVSDAVLLEARDVPAEELKTLTAIENFAAEQLSRSLKRSGH